MEKKISFGKHAINSGRKINEVVIELELKDNKDGKPVFTACCDVWNSKHTDIVMGGQCLDDVADCCRELRHNRLYKEILGLWQRNHLNDMHAGTERQEEEIKRWKEQGNRYDYTAVCEHLKSVGLYDDNGYKYGHGWLYRDISDDDLKRIKEIIEA